MTTPSQHLADYIACLTAEECAQLQDLSEYLGEKAGPGNPTGRMAEKSIPKLLNAQPEKVRQAVKGLQDVISAPRELPFQEKRSEAENLNRLGLDHESGSAIMATLDTSDVITGIQSRLGTDASRQDDPITTRDILSAAYDQHAGE